METSLVVEQVAFGGKGLGRLPNGKVCFIPQVIPGERVSLRIQRERASYAEAELTEILLASPDRIEPRCPVFGECGGCQYQHIAYPRQLALKTAQVADALRRIGGLQDPPVELAIGSPREFHYRNRITVHAKNGRIGFYGARSHRIVDVPECPIASFEVNALLAKLRQSQPRDGEYPLREPGSYRGFRQVNNAAAGLLLDAVFSMALPGGALLVDAYCGAGFFAKKLRELFTSVIGIEWSPDAVRAAREDLTPSETYLMGDVRDHLPSALASGVAKETTLLIDPPAEGIEADVLALILAHGPERVLYVSCNPATLARDIKRLGGAYQLRRVTPVDMFPQTAEIEAAALLHRLS